MTWDILEMINMEWLNKHLLEILIKQILDDDDNDDVDVNVDGDDSDDGGDNNWWCKKAIVQGLAWAH